MASRTGTVSRDEPKISVSFRDGKLVMRTRTDDKSESTPSMTIELDNPNRISIRRLEGMDDPEATDFRASAAMFVAE